MRWGCTPPNRNERPGGSSCWRAATGRGWRRRSSRPSRVPSWRQWCRPTLADKCQRRQACTMTHPPSPLVGRPRTRKAGGVHIANRFPGGVWPGLVDRSKRVAEAVGEGSAAVGSVHEYLGEPVEGSAEPSSSRRRFWRRPVCSRDRRGPAPVDVEAHVAASWITWTAVQRCGPLRRRRGSLGWWRPRPLRRRPGVRGGRRRRRGARCWSKGRPARPARPDGPHRFRGPLRTTNGFGEVTQRCSLLHRGVRLDVLVDGAAKIGCGRDAGADLVAGLRRQAAGLELGEQAAQAKSSRARHQCGDTAQDVVGAAVVGRCCCPSVSSPMRVRWSRPGPCRRRRRGKGRRT